MNKSSLLRWFLTASFFAVIFGVMMIPVHAQTVVDPVTTAPDVVIPDALSNWLLAFITKLAAAHPAIATIITLMGTARVWAKPVMSLIHNFIELSPSKRDDGILTSILEFFNSNSVGRFLAYLLDWFTSIKIQVPNYPDTGKPAAPLPPTS